MAKIFKKLTNTEIEDTAELSATEVVSREKAKADLERRIAEKLSQMSETDLEELFMMHEQQLRARKVRERNTVGRHGGVYEGQLSFGEVKEDEEEAQLDVIIKAQNRNFQDYFDEFASGSALEALDVKIRAFFRKIAGGKAISAIRRFSKTALQKTASFLNFITSWVPSFTDVFPKRPTPEQRKARKAKYVLLKYKRRLMRRERWASSRMAGIISVMDSGNDKLAEATSGFVRISGNGIYAAREWTDHNKKKLLAGLVVIIMSAVAYVSVVNHYTAYVYAYNGRPLGLVKNQEDVLRVLDVVSLQLTREYGAEIEIDKEQNITFERIFRPEQEIDDMQEVFNRLTYMQDMNVRAYALYIDNIRIAIFDTSERAEQLLEDYTNIYLSQPHMEVTYEEVAFAESVDIRPLDTQLGRIQNSGEVIDRMLTGAMAHKTHYVEKGETFSGIAKKYGISMDELESTNQGITPARLSIGQEIILEYAVPLLTVQTVEVATYNDVLPFETIYEDNASIFKGEQSTKVKGVNGEREVTARIIRNNGIEVGREELNSIILKESSAAVVMRGTKDPPPAQGTGQLKYPVSGYRLTSKFGSRSGRMHYGIDMACKSGTRIGAADGGTVTFAGYQSSFGYLVIINHGANMETYYAHCSALFVKKGEKVHQGQHIANVGSTGRSSGPHLHFEVHVNGTARNPLNYL